MEETTRDAEGISMRRSGDKVGDQTRTSMIFLVLFFDTGMDPVSLLNSNDSNR